MDNKTLADHRRELKAVAKTLMPYTFPKVNLLEDQKITVFKQRRTTIDGYDVQIYYNISEYPKFEVHTVHLQAIYSPFLPFTTVCKLGRFFLGSRNLSYVEFFNSEKKIYCWTVRMQDGKSMSPGQEQVHGFYEGFSYNVLNPGSVDLY